MQVARLDHDRALAQHLIEPLRRWALAQEDPVSRNLGAELAGFFGLVHKMGPLVHEALDLIQDDRGGATSADLLSLIEPYLQLGRRSTDLVRTLRTWRRWA